MPVQDRTSTGELLIYATEDGRTRVECRLDGDTLWLTQALMAELFQKDVRTVNEHLKNIYADGELDPTSTIRDFRIVQIEEHSRALSRDSKSTGKQSLHVEVEPARSVERNVKHYNLEAILAVGYRVRSARGVQFRRWATERLSEYLVKGFTMDDERLRNPPVAGMGVPDYFDELLARIRDIRASERRMYLRVQEIFKMAADYAVAPDTSDFFATMQNKLHHAVHGRTAAEVVLDRADHTKPNMGLTSWKGEVVRKADVSTAKNYLDQEEIEEFNRIVVMWLDFAEDQARRRKQIFLRDWETKLDEFLRFNERRVLRNAGTVSNKQATAKAEAEYAAFAEHRRAWLEAQGAEASVRALEDAAKQLPTARAAKAPGTASKPKKDQKP